MYQGTGTGQDNECENCGAQLPLADASGVRTCSFCKAVYATPVAPPQPSPQVNVVFNTPGYTSMPEVDFNPVNPQKAKSGCGCGGLLLVLIILASVGVPLYFGLRESGFGNPFKPSYTFGSGTQLLPGEPNGPMRFVNTSSHYADGKTQVEVVLFNGVDGSAQWTSPTITDGAVDLPLLVDGTNVYALAKTKVFAFKQSDGTQAWQGSLTDEVDTYQGCDCAIIGNLLVVKAKDGELTAFDTATGATKWTRTLEETSDKVIFAKTALLVEDETVNESGGGLATVDLATGENAKPIDPQCTPREGGSVQHADFSSVWKQDPSSTGLIVFFGSSPTCIQGWDPVAGTMGWAVMADRTSFDSSSTEVIDSTFGLVTSDRTSIGLIGADRATYQDVVVGDQVQYHPVGFNGSTLVTEAKSTRGTTKMSIQGIDFPAGTKKWEASLGKSQSIVMDESSSWSVGSDGTFTSHVDGGTVYVVTMKEGSGYDQTIFVDAIDIATGTTAPQKQLDPDSHDLIPAFGPPDWRGTKLLTRIGDDTMQVIDASTGTVTYRAP